MNKYHNMYQNLLTYANGYKIIITYIEKFYSNKLLYINYICIFSFKTYVFYKSTT